MKRILKRSRQQLYSLQTVGVVLCMVFVFFTNLYDAGTNTSLMEAVVTESRSNLLQDPFGCSLWQIYGCARTNEAILYFFPALIGMVVTKRFLEEWNSHYVVHIFGRMDKREYLREMFYSAGVTSGCMALAAWGIFSIISMILLPAFSSYDDAIKCNIYSMITEIQINSVTEIQIRYIVLNVLLSLGTLVVFSVLVGMLDMLVAAVSRNIYISICLPCYLFYLLNLVSRRLFLYTNSCYWAKYLSPGILLQWDKNNLLGYLCLVIVLVGGISYFFYLNMEKGVDKCNG